MGLAGAVVGRLARGRLGRVQLALACGVSALAAKEVMNVYTWTLGASHTPAAFMLVAGQALAYDITDVVASFLFGLAFAPELARVLGERACACRSCGSPLADDDGGHGRRRARRRARGGARVCARRAHGPRSRCRAGVPGSAHAAQPAGPGVARQVVLPRRRAELRRRFRRRSRADQHRAVLRLGRDRARRSRSRPAEPAQGRAHRARCAARRSGLAARRGRPRADDPRAARVRRLDALAARRGPASQGSCTCRRATAPSATSPTSPPSPCSRCARPGYRAGEGSVRERCPLAARQQNRDGGFGFQARGGPSDVDDTGAALQALRGCRAGGDSPRRAPPSPSCARNQNLDGGFPQQPEAPPTRSPRRGRSRALLPRDSTPQASPAPAAARRSATCGASSRPTAACATRAPAPRRRCG